MGARANYVVVQGGTWTLHYSNWGASRIAADLAFGPTAAVRAFRANPQVGEEARLTPDGWLDDVWCEGAALVDVDRQVLLWFSGEADEWAEHVAYRTVLERAWAGWEVRWAFDGLGDLPAHLGLGRGLVRQRPDFRETTQPYWQQPERWTKTLLTALGPEGERGAWASGYDLDEELSGGAGLLDLLPADTPPPVLTAMPNGGLHFDVAARTLGVWTVGTAPGFHDWPLAGWEGWKLDFWGADHGRQAAVAGVGFPPAEAEVRAAVGAFRDRLELPPDDPAAILRLAASSADPATTAVLSPAATVPHESPDPTAADRSALSTVFSTLLP
jgi:hypothetical protein